MELLERKQLFVGGLTHFKGHTVALKEKCAPNLIITLKESFAQTAETVLALGALDTDATDSTTSTAAGEGLAVAKVGEASEFVLSAVAVGSGEQRRFGGDKVNVTLVRAGAVDEGAAPSSGGGSGGAASKPESGKRKRGGGSGASGGKGRASKKSKSGASTSVSTAGARSVEGSAVDCGDGTYNCSYTPLVEGGAAKPEVRHLEVLLNGKHIVGSPFAVEVRPAYTNWVFRSIPTDNRYEQLHAVLRLVPSLSRPLLLAPHTPTHTHARTHTFSFSLPHTLSLSLSLLIFSRAYFRMAVVQQQEEGVAEISTVK